MVPKRGTHLEYKNKVRTGEVPHGALGAKWEGLPEYYVHSSKIVDDRRQQSGSYLPATTLHLAKGHSESYSFSFAWAKSYADIRQVLYDLGSLDAISLPGMVVPADTRVTLAVRAQDGIASVSGDATANIVAFSTKNGYNFFEITFAQTGQWQITVKYDKTQRSVLQYLSIEPIGQLISRRVAFLAALRQAKTSSGFDGAFLQWDMVSKRLVTGSNCPEAEGCWKEWMSGGSDDLGLAPAIFLSEKNAFTTGPGGNRFDRLLHSPFFARLPAQRG